MNVACMLRFLSMFVAAAVPFLALGDDEVDQAPLIPSAPEQTTPWTPPPTQLPPIVVDVIKELFDEGVADPRGCEYRQIEVAWGEVTINTHGWVLPGDGPVRFAVGWDGLVYPLKSVGLPVSLEDDVPGKNPREGFQGLDNNWPAGKNWSLSVESLMPIKAALLLRLGRSDLAEDLWKRGFVNHPGMVSNDPYVFMANPWLYALYERAVRAHVTSDDRLALNTCRFLLPVQQRAEASATKRGIELPAKDKLYFEDLAQLPELAADQERRAIEAPHESVIESGKPAEGPDRVAALVRDLEQVSVTQLMNPGQTDTFEDPAVQSLIKEGDAAIEPLLKCWEEDPRLTRTQFSRGMGFTGPVVHVYEPAYIALSVIMDKQFYFSDDDNTSPYHSRSPVDPRDQDPRNLTVDDRKFLGKKIRTYLDKYKGMTLPERWFADLQDDSSGPESWIRAIEKIAQPADQIEVSFGIFGGSMGWGFPTHAGKPVRGESLRAKMNPSVSDLIIKRFNQLMPMAKSNSEITFDHMGNLILALADWDGKNHLGEIRDFSRQFQTQFKVGTAGFNSVNDTMISLFQRRALLGDPSVLQDYEAWLQTLSPKDLTNPLQSARPFQLMWHYPGDASMLALAEKLFTRKDAPWLPLPNVLVHTPLIGFDAFRQELLRGLSDTSSAGRIKVDLNSTSYNFERTGGTSTESSNPPQGSSDRPAPGTIITFRLCDCYAYQLSQVESFPSFKLYWPLGQRDAAIAVFKKFLRQYGEAYRGHPVDYYDSTIGAPDYGTARFFIPSLDHPATTEDVKAGRAIFAISGTTRVWKMPSQPMGSAWQAEEVLRNGKWERYFGVVAHGVPTKVPADKIDFAGTSYPPPSKVTGEINGELGGPPIPGVGEGIGMFGYGLRHALPINSPVPITVDITNHSGLDLVTPASLLLPPGAKKTLPEGVSLSVFYSEKLAPAVQRFTQPIFNPAPYHELPLRNDVSITQPQSVGPILSPTQKLNVLSIDLRDFFDISHPGSYQVKARFQVPGQPPADSNLVNFSVAQAPP